MVQVPFGVARIDPRNVTRYWWDRHLPGLSLLHADFTTHEYPPHTHEALVVAVTEQGGSIVKSRGQVEDAEASRVFVFNPAEPHAGWMGRSERWQYRSLYLTKLALDRLAELHVVAQENEVARGSAHRHEIGERDLARLVDEDVVEPLVEPGIGKQPCGTGHELGVGGLDLVVRARIADHAARELRFLAG